MCFQIILHCCNWVVPSIGLKNEITFIVNFIQRFKNSDARQKSGLPELPLEIWQSFISLLSPFDFSENTGTQISL